MFEENEESFYLSLTLIYGSDFITSVANYRKHEVDVLTKR